MTPTWAEVDPTLLEELRASSQLIVITHQKRLMEFADAFMASRCVATASALSSRSGSGTFQEA